MQRCAGSTIDLLSHRRSPQDEERLIDDGALALENLRRQEEELNARATELLGHGDFIQNKAKAAMDLGRYIRGDDLYFVKDGIEKAGSRVIVNGRPFERGRSSYQWMAEWNFMRS